MPLLAGTRFGTYDVLGPLGLGGMGEVYRARDTKLGRDVALKILPELFAADPDRLARFHREAQVLASLNHPNVAQIYGLEEAAGLRALVLELVEGPTLAERIARGPMPLDDALPIARQIAEALEAAHEQGIIHRDLKPANIKCTPRGTVKVLDFGLAKLVDPMGSGVPAGVASSQSPTITSPAMTRAGVILGTAAYMSPEQARGQPVDERADIWAFGCVLFEMLTGRRAYEREEVTDTLAAIVRDEPQWSALPADTPTAIRRLLRRCLTKDLKGRIPDAGIARIEIDEVKSAPETDGQVGQSVPSPRKWLPWMAALTVAALSVAAIVTWLLRPGPPPPEVRLEITTPPTTDPVSLALSPDGQKIVFAGLAEGGARLWLRSLDSVLSRPLVGTDAAYYPFWSPDGRAVGFFAEGKLKRIDIDAGSVQALANATAGRGGAWTGDGVILFAPQAGPIFRISATGGERTQLTQLEPQVGGHRFPQLLPDGRHFIYYVTGIPTVRGVYVSRLDGSERRRVVDADAAAVYARSGHLLFVRQGTLYAQPFNPVRLELAGNLFPLARDVAVDGGVGIAAVSASAAGPVVYRGGLADGRRHLAWLDRAGKEIGRVGGPGDGSASGLSMSPDGRSVGLSRAVDGNEDIWLIDTERGTLRRFTSDPARDVNPIWSPDGRRIVFASSRTGVGDLYEKPVSGGGDEKRLLATPLGKQVADWSSDGRFLLYRTQDPKTKYDIWAWPVGEGSTPFAVVQTNFDERDAQFSPDGKWIAYESDESGRFEIYVQLFPGPGTKWPISTGGGAQVRWRRDGKELFYIALNNELMAVPIRLDSDRETVEARAPVPLFTTHVGGAVSVNRQQYVVAPDGQRFLMNTVTEEANTSPITVILNWKPTF